MPNQNHNLVNISTEKWQDWYIVSIEGAFVIREFNEIRSVFETVEKNQKPQVALDFSKVTYLDSSAISVMVNFQKRLRDVHGELVIFGPNGDTKDILSISSLDIIIQVFQTRAEFENSC